MICPGVGNVLVHVRGRKDSDIASKALVTVIKTISSRNQVIRPVRVRTVGGAVDYHFQFCKVCISNTAGNLRLCLALDIEGNRSSIEIPLHAIPGCGDGLAFAFTVSKLVAIAVPLHIRSCLDSDLAGIRVNVLKSRVLGQIVELIHVRAVGSHAMHLHLQHADVRGRNALDIESDNSGVNSPSFEGALIFQRDSFGVLTNNVVIYLHLADVLIYILRGLDGNLAGVAVRFIALDLTDSEITILQVIEPVVMDVTLAVDHNTQQVLGLGGIGLALDIESNRIGICRPFLGFSVPSQRNGLAAFLRVNKLMIWPGVGNILVHVRGRRDIDIASKALVTVIKTIISRNQVIRPVCVRTVGGAVDYHFQFCKVFISNNAGDLRFLCGACHLENDGGVIRVLKRPLSSSLVVNQVDRLSGISFLMCFTSGAIERRDIGLGADRNNAGGGIARLVNLANCELGILVHILKGIPFEFRLMDCTLVGALDLHFQQILKLIKCGLFDIYWGILRLASGTDLDVLCSSGPSDRAIPQSQRNGSQVLRIGKLMVGPDTKRRGTAVHLYKVRCKEGDGVRICTVAIGRNFIGIGLSEAAYVGKQRIPLRGMATVFGHAGNHHLHLARQGSFNFLIGGNGGRSGCPALHIEDDGQEIFAFRNVPTLPIVVISQHKKSYSFLTVGKHMIRAGVVFFVVFRYVFVCFNANVTSVSAPVRRHNHRTQYIIQAIGLVFMPRDGGGAVNRHLTKQIGNFPTRRAVGCILLPHGIQRLGAGSISNSARRVGAVDIDACTRLVSAVPIGILPALEGMALASGDISAGDLKHLILCTGLLGDVGKRTGAAVDVKLQNEGERSGLRLIRGTFY